MSTPRLAASAENTVIAPLPHSPPDRLPRLLADPLATRPAGRWPSLLGGLVLGLLLVACGNTDSPGDDQHTADAGNASAGERSAPDAIFRTLRGESLALRELSGPVLVNFWSTSCGICLEEMPEMVALYERFASRGFELVAVAMPSDPPNEVLELAKARDLPYPVAIDIDGEVLKQFDSVKGTPTSFLFDANGTEVARYVGAIDMEALDARLTRLTEPAG